MEAARLDLASRVPWAVFPRKRLDASFADMYSSVLHCLEAAPDESQYSAFTDALEADFHPTDPARAFATLSVRTTWDLFLDALDLPAGSEIVMSGITIKDMVGIPLSKGFVPIAVDVCEATLEVDFQVLEQAITDRTRVIIISHVFGAIGDMRRITALAKTRGIAVFEDCAEAYVGPDYRGHPDSTIVAFSFGTIKTDTALGGCLSVVNDSSLLDRMRTANYQLPRRSHSFFLRRIAKHLAFHSLMRPDVWGLIIKAARLVGVNHDEIITAASRGFPGDMITGIRHRPSAPLIRLLHRRITNFDVKKLTRRCELAHKLRRLLKAGAEDRSGVVATFRIPGADADSHSYWLFPVWCGEDLDLNQVCAEMTKKGYDVTSGATQLGSVAQYVPKPSELFTKLEPIHATALMSRIVYLPVVAEMPEFVLRDMATTFLDVVSRQVAHSDSSTTASGSGDELGDLDLDDLDLDDLDDVGGDSPSSATVNESTADSIRTSAPPAFVCHSKL